jgi:hypothetical protein
MPSYHAALAKLALFADLPEGTLPYYIASKNIERAYIDWGMKPAKS